MKKQILNLGKALNKAEQKTIKGGNVLAEFESSWVKCNGDNELYEVADCGASADYACAGNGGWTVCA